MDLILFTVKNLKHHCVPGTCLGAVGPEMDILGVCS